jgi:hypothetical protein
VVAVEADMACRCTAARRCISAAYRPGSGGGKYGSVALADLTIRQS